MTSFRGLSILAVAAVILCAMATVAWAVQTPVFDYQFPASYDGSTTACDDLSAANHDATIAATGAYAVGVHPPGFGDELGSLNGAAGGRVQTNDALLLANNLVAQYGGFEYDTWIKPVTYGTVQPYYIDYAGTEMLRLDRSGTSPNYTYRFQFRARDGWWNVYSNPIDLSKWYHVRVSFDSVGLQALSTNEQPGVAVLVVEDPVAGTTDTQWTGMTKTIYGDGLSRKMGVNRHSNSATSSNSQAYLFNPKVSLGPDPNIDAIGLITPPTGVGNTVAHWKLDDAVGSTTIVDSGPNGLNGTAAGAVTLGRPGAVAGSGTAAGVNLDQGNTGYVSVPSNALLNSDSFSVCLWMKFDAARLASTTAWQVPIDNRGSGTTGWSITVGPNNPATYNSEIIAMIGAGGSSNWSRMMSNPLVADEWTHLAMTYDADTDIGRLYINGELMSIVHTAYSPNATANGLRLGNQNTGGGNQFCGDLDDVRLYDFALTDQQVVGLIPEPGVMVLLLGALVGLVAPRARRERP